MAAYRRLANFVNFLSGGAMGNQQPRSYLDPMLKEAIISWARARIRSANPRLSEDEITQALLQWADRVKVDDWTNDSGLRFLRKLRDARNRDDQRAADGHITDDQTDAEGRRAAARARVADPAASGSAAASAAESDSTAAPAAPATAALPAEENLAPTDYRSCNWERRKSIT